MNYDLPVTVLALADLTPYPKNPRSTRPPCAWAWRQHDALCVHSY